MVYSINQSFAYPTNKSLMDYILLHPEEVACFTGQRPNKLGGYDEKNPIAQASMRALYEMIQAAKVEGYRYFISGLALGVDTWAARLVLADPEINLIAAVPCPGQEKFWKKDSQEEYHRLLATAAHVEVVSPEYSDKAMLDRNIWMVDRSSLVLSVWNGDYKGGTAHCLRDAKKKGLPILRFNPLSGAMDDAPELNPRPRSDKK